jgi:Uncharacterized protein conserved in bacteria (DUF2169)
MDRGEWPVAITSLGGAAVATVVWRRQTQLHVTVVVKGSFGFVPDGVMTPIEPEPIARDERPDAEGVGLSAAGDLAPYLALTDVWLTGHRVAPQPGASPRDHERRPGTPTRPPVEPPGAAVRLGVFRESAALLDKSLELAIPSATARRIPIGGMGPLSRHWPIRSRLLGAVDPRRLEGAILEIPEPFDWSYFQVAPLDQRIEWLHGDEWVVLKGMHPERDSLATRLPGAVGAARLYGQAAGLRQGRPLRLSADTLRIDVDRQICSVTWRGQFPVSGEDALAAMHLLAGVELPGRPLVWTDPFQSGLAAGPVESAPIAMPPPAAPKGDPLGGTMDISAADAAVLLAGIVTPFQPETGPERRNPRITHANAKAPRAVVAPRPTAPVAVAYDPLGSTADVDADAAAQARAGYVTPFATAPASAAEQPHFDQVAPVAPQYAAGAPDLSSTPWEAPSPIEQAPPLRLDVAPPALSHEDDDSPKGLGAHFLAAMASSRAQRGSA